MKKTTMRGVTLCTFAIFITFVVTLVSQEPADIAKGLTPYGSFKGGNVDSINMTNGNLVLHIPLYSIPQKGKLPAYSRTIYYNDKHWVVTAYTGTTGEWAPLTTIQFAGEVEGFDDDANQGVYVATDSDVGGQTETSYLKGTRGSSSGTLVQIPLVSSYYITPDGGKHLYNTYMVGTSTYYNNFPTLDGSNLVPVSSGVMDHNGLLHNSTYGVVDSNGVKMFPASTTDSYGRSYKTATTAEIASALAQCSNADSASVEFVPTYNGSQAEYIYCYKNKTGTTSFDVPVNSAGTCSSGGTTWTSVLEGSATELRLNEIILPNGKTYTFTYDSYLSLTNVTFPTGGSISYTWANVTSGSSCRTRVVSTRTVSDGSISSTWTYTWNDSSSSDVMYTVTSPAGNAEVHHHATGSGEFEADYYSGTQSGGTLLKKVTTTFDSEPAYVDTVLGTIEQGTNLNTPLTVTTSVYDNSGNAYTSEVVNQYEDVTSNGPTVSLYNYAGGTFLTCETSSCLQDPPPSESVTIGFKQLRAATEYNYGTANSGVGSAVRTTVKKYAWEDSTDYPSIAVACSGCSVGANVYTTNGLLDLESAEHVASGYVTGSSFASSPSGALKTTTYTYDTYGNLTATALNGLTTATYTYNSSGLPLTVADAAGHTTTHTYGGACNSAVPTSTTTPSGLTVSGGYDCNAGGITSFTDANGGSYSFTYDTDFNRILTASYPGGGSASLSYDDTNLVVTEAQAIDGSNTATTEIKFDGLGREIKRASQMNSSQWRESDTTYDAMGRKKLVAYPFIVSSPWGSSTTGDTYTYDALSRPLTVTHADSTVVTSAYNGRAVRVTDESGKARISQSDALGRMLSVCEVTSTALGGLGGTTASCGQDASATGFLTNYTYSPLDNLTTVAQGRLTNRTFTYDTSSRLLTAYNPESGTITYTYPASGNICSGNISQPCTKSDARSVTTTYTYDVENRLSKKVYSDGTNTACFLYGTSADSTNHTGGRLVSEWTQSSTTCPSSAPAIGTSLALRTLTYDAMGRAKGDTQQVNYGDKAARTLSYAYNYLGGVTSTSDGISTARTTAFTYDLGSELLTATSTLSGGSTDTLFSSASYVAAGLSSATLGTEVSMARTYDTRNRLLTEADTNASGGTTVAATSGHGTLTVSGSSTSTSYCPVTNYCTTISNSGSVTVTIGGTAYTTGYGSGYTSSTVASNLASVITAGSLVTATASGSTITLTAKATGTATNYSVSTSCTYNSSYFSTCDFTVSGSAMTGGTAAYTTSPAIYNYTVAYASNGNVASMADAVMGTWSYTYDDFNRLAAAVASAGTFSGATVAWSYDRYGNRLSQSGSGSSNLSLTAGTYTYTAANNRIDALSGNYDASGNLKTDASGTTYTYDAENRVASVNASTYYVYDAEGRRVAKLNAAGTATATYLLGLGGEQLVELNVSGTVQHRNVYAGGKLLATYDSSSVAHLHLDDWLGTRRMQVALDGTKQLGFQSLPFGDSLATVTYLSGSTDPTEQHFTGKERDTESGNDYFGARYYASSMGRFLSPDWSAKIEPVPYSRLDNPQTLNLYAYVGNNPLSRTDPTGHADIAAECKGQATCHKTVVDTVNIVHYDKKTKSTVVDSTLQVTTNFTVTTNAKGAMNVSASSTVEQTGGDVKYSAGQLKTMSTDIGVIQQKAVTMGFGANTTQMMTAVGAAETAFGTARASESSPFKAPGINPLQLSGGRANGNLGHNVQGALNVFDYFGRQVDFDPIPTYRGYSDGSVPTMANFTSTYNSVSETQQ